MSATTQSAPNKERLAALQNLDAAWHKIFDKIGLNVVVVQFNTQMKSPIHAHPEIENALGLELQQIGAGYYDSSFYPGCHDSKSSGSAWHFFYAHNLGAVMQRLKSQLAVRGLLGIVNILHAEESNQLRVWYSYDPDAIGKLIEG